VGGGGVWGAGGGRQKEVSIRSAKLLEIQIHTVVAVAGNFCSFLFRGKALGGRSTGGNGECGRQQMLQNCVQIVAVVSHNFPGLHD